MLKILTLLITNVNICKALQGWVIYVSTLIQSFKQARGWTQYCSVREGFTLGLSMSPVTLFLSFSFIHFTFVCFFFIAFYSSLRLLHILLKHQGGWHFSSYFHLTDHTTHRCSFKAFAHKFYIDNCCVFYIHVSLFAGYECHCVAFGKYLFCCFVLNSFSHVLLMAVIRGGKTM